MNTGMVTALWRNLYIQVDYNFEGDHYAEKFLLLGREGSTGTQLYVVAGPYGEDIDAQKVSWNDWFKKVKELSERNIMIYD